MNRSLLFSDYFEINNSNEFEWYCENNIICDVLVFIVFFVVFINRYLDLVLFVRY